MFCRKLSGPIRFVPACLVSSRAKYSFAELLEFTNRQLKITRVYAPHLWKPLLLGSLLLLGLFWRAGAGRYSSDAWIKFHPATDLSCGDFRAGRRNRMFGWVRLDEFEVVRNSRCWIRAAHLLLWPFASALYLWNTIVAGFSRRIAWRGITYELKSPTEAVIISRED